MGLRKEGDRAVQAVREKIQKKFFSDKTTFSMTETDKDKDTRAKEALKLGEEYKDKNHTGKGLCPIYYNSRKHSFSSTELRGRVKNV